MFFTLRHQCRLLSLIKKGKMSAIFGKKLHYTDLTKLEASVSNSNNVFQIKLKKQELGFQTYSLSCEIILNFQSSFRKQKYHHNVLCIYYINTFGVQLTKLKLQARTHWTWNILQINIVQRLDIILFLFLYLHSVLQNHQTLLCLSITIWLTVYYYRWYKKIFLAEMHYQAIK